MMSKLRGIQDDQQAKEIYDESFKLEDSQELDEALEQRKRLIAYDSRNPFFWAVLGKSHESLDSLEQAEECYKKAISLKPDEESFSLLLFNLLWDSGRKDEGFDEMRRFVPYGGSPIYTELLKNINSS